MLAYALAGESSYLWVVTKDSAQFLPIKAKASEIQANLAKVRAQMEFDAAGNAPSVSVDVLHALYQALLAPAVPYLGGISHLLIVPDGALQSLPFGMLVVSPPPAIAGDADYRKVDWLARHYAMSVLPAVGSIKALRQFAKAEGAKEPFAGFGDPLVGEVGGASRGKRAKVDIATVFRGSRVRGASGQPLPTLEIADVEAIRKAPRLPETAEELRAIGKALKAGADSIWLQQKATETAVKTMNLSKYQTLAFATHGMMAGDVGGVGEPGLMLTPPKEGTLEDDGYLAASEIAKLRLNSDWTILSACNTAAADGTPGAEGLSGLAKAFFYAGSRSLLVSHWPVASDATVPLTTRTLTEYRANPAQGKAEAHRKSMLALMASPDHPEFAHPIFWAPFVVVGEGGANRPYVRRHQNHSPRPVRRTIITTCSAMTSSSPQRLAADRCSGWLYSCALSLGYPLAPRQLENNADWDRLNKEVLALFENGQYAQAEVLATQALRIAEKEAGPDHPAVARSLNDLAVIYERQGKYQAEPLDKRSLNIREKALGPDHPDVATSLISLAHLHKVQGKYAEAEPLYKRSLAIYEKALGPDHQEVATSLNNLAVLIQNQGKYAEAEPLYKRSLAINEKTSGPDHPDARPA